MVYENIWMQFVSNNRQLISIFDEFNGYQLIDSLNKAWPKEGSAKHLLSSKIEERRPLSVKPEPSIRRTDKF